MTDNQGKIKEANRIAAQLLNIKPNFLINKSLVNFIPFEERRAFRQKLNQLLLTNQRQEWELRIRPRRAEIFEAGLTVSTIWNWQRKPMGCRWLILDLTSRKQTEEKIRQIELQNVQLEAAAKLKSHFLALMSHELRTPINAIAGFSQLLLRQSQPPLATNQAEMAKRIFKGSQNLLQLVEDILDFSKIEVGNLQLQLTEFNLAELIVETTEEIRSLVEQKNLGLQVHVNIQNSSVVNDSDRLRQVLVNLLSNAIKFTDTGNICVEVWELPSNQLAIVVKDTGIGIAQEDIQSIFQEFWQVDRSMTRKHGGTSLGLAITDKLVHLMQGKITVESQLRRGSTFRVELPRWVNKPLN